jgi:hypothetical protein
MHISLAFHSIKFGVSTRCLKFRNVLHFLLCEGYFLCEIQGRYEMRVPLQNKRYIKGISKILASLCKEMSKY